MSNAAVSIEGPQRDDVNGENQQGRPPGFSQRLVDPSSPDGFIFEGSHHGIFLVDSRSRKQGPTCDSNVFRTIHQGGTRSEIYAHTIEYRAADLAHLIGARNRPSGIYDWWQLDNGNERKYAEASWCSRDSYFRYFAHLHTRQKWCDEHFYRRCKEQQRENDAEKKPQAMAEVGEEGPVRLTRQAPEGMQSQFESYACA